MNTGLEIRIDSLERSLNRLRGDFDALIERLRQEKRQQQEEKFQQQEKKFQRRERMMGVFVVIVTLLYWVGVLCLAIFAPE